MKYILRIDEPDNIETETIRDIADILELAANAVMEKLEREGMPRDMSLVEWALIVNTQHAGTTLSIGDMLTGGAEFPELRKAVYEQIAGLILLLREIDERQT